MALAWVLLAVVVTGCSVTSRVSPAQYVPTRAPEQITVLDKAGRYYVLDQPALVGEQIRGIDDATSDTVSLPLSRVEEATVTRKSPARTVILAGVLAGGAAAIVISAHGKKGDSCKLIDDHEDVVGKGTQCDPDALAGN